MAEETEYLRDLALHLRWRHLSEDAVSAAVAKARHDLGTSGRTGQELFGSPAEYAKTFSKGSRWSQGFLIASALAALATLAVGVLAFVGLVLRQGPGPLVSLSIMVGALLLVAAGFIAGSSLDRRLPQDAHVRHQG